MLVNYLWYLMRIRNLKTIYQHTIFSQAKESRMRGVVSVAIVAVSSWPHHPNLHEK